MCNKNSFPTPDYSYNWCECKRLDFFRSCLSSLCDSFNSFNGCTNNRSSESKDDGYSTCENISFTDFEDDNECERGGPYSKVYNFSSDEKVVNSSSDESVFTMKGTSFSGLNMSCKKKLCLLGKVKRSEKKVMFDCIPSVGDDINTHEQEKGKCVVKKKKRKKNRECNSHPPSRREQIGVRTRSMVKKQTEKGFSLFSSDESDSPLVLTRSMTKKDINLDSRPIASRTRLQRKKEYMSFFSLKSKNSV
jgi:hypothetical protein